MTPPWMIHIVDDDDAVRTSMQFALEMAGFRVHAYSGAADLLSRADKEPGILICDVGMPGMTGVELTRFLQAHGSAMRIILVTGSHKRAVDADAIAPLVEAVLEKPVALADLLAEIARATADWA